jgi:hypothetical protein
MILENVSHHLSHQMCNGGKVCLVGEHPDITPSQFVICKENWGKQMLKHSEGKLCSYSKFKTYFGLEKYYVY